MLKSRQGASGLFFAMILGAVFLATGCGPSMKGAVKEDVSLTKQTQELEGVGTQYRGPDYNIAILEFDNKTPSGVLGVGEAATDILRTIVKQSGLEPVVLTKGEMQEQERLMELQQTGALRKGIKDPGAGFESVDFRITGSITSYGEVEESLNTLLTQSKTRIARVQVDYALVDVDTGKSLLSESGVGEYRKKTGGVLGMGSKSSVDPGLRDGALRDALSKAMTKMIEKLNAIPFKSRVVLVEGPNVIIRAGTRSRLSPGTVMGVYRVGDDLIDPETGRVIGQREKKIGEVTITGHQGENVSDTTVKSGSGFRTGDVVKALD